MKMFCIVKKTSSDPELDRTLTPYTGHGYIGAFGQWAGYIISGTKSQLQAINALPQVYGLAYVTEAEGAHWTELDNAIAPAMRNKVNTWLTANAQAIIPAGWTNKKVIKAIMLKMNPIFEWGQHDIMDVE